MVCRLAALIFTLHSGQWIAFASIALRLNIIYSVSGTDVASEIGCIVMLETPERQLVVELIEDVLQDLLLRAVAAIPNIATHVSAARSK